MWPDPPGVAWLPGEPSILWPELRALGPITAPFSGVLDRHPEGGHQGGSYGKGHVGSGRREGNREMQGAGRPGGRTRGLPVAWPWSPSHVQWSAVSSPVWAAQGKQTGVRGRGGPRQRLLSCSPELPPLPLHAGGQPPALRGALCSPPHSTSCLPPVWHPVWGLPGARSPVSSSCLSPDCELQWLVDSSDSREYLLPPPHPPAAHLPTANAVTPMVRFSGWYMSCRSSGSKVPSETMGANQGVSVSSSVGLSAGGAAGAETLPSGKPRSHPGPASHAV